jgi:hypothetical protein
MGAIVLSTDGVTATVRLAQRGAVYHNLNVLGGRVAVGQGVLVSFASGSPVVLATPTEEITQTANPRTRPLAPISHMNQDLTNVTSGSTGASYSTVDYRYMFAPILGGSVTLSGTTTTDRLGVGTGPYYNGSAIPDYCGISMGAGAFKAFAAFVAPFDVLSLTITPVAHLLAQLGSNISFSYEVNAYTGYYSAPGFPKRTATGSTTLIASILPFFRRLTETQVTIVDIDAADIFFIYAQASGAANTPFYLSGFLVELIGVP